jgi:LPS sulfotransferase NodH
MKILLYTGYRTGSKSLGNWLKIELNMPYFHEYYNKSNEEKWNYYKKIDLNKINDYIIKISPNDGFDFDELIKEYDKVILLYREDTISQAQSMMWAKDTQLWHHTYLGDKFISAHYTIPIEWLNKNAEEINSINALLTKENELLKSLTNCLHITYEELYYSVEGIKKIENYLGFKSKSKFNKIHKLRNVFIKKSLT